MGLMDFVRSAGRILGGPTAAVNAAIEDAAKAQKDMPPPSADAVKTEIKRIGLPDEAVHVAVEGDTVHIKGKVSDAAIKEKLILAAGNIQGVGKVSDDIETEQGGPA